MFSFGRILKNIYTYIALDLYYSIMKRYKWFVIVFQARLSVSCATMADAFSSSSESVIQRVVDVTARTSTPLEKLHESYQIRETCEFISEGHFGKVRTSLFTFFIMFCYYCCCCYATSRKILHFLHLVKAASSSLNQNNKLK